MRGRVYGLVRGRGVCRACVEFYGLLYTSITQSTNQFIYTLLSGAGAITRTFLGLAFGEPSSFAACEGGEGGGGAEERSPAASLAFWLASQSSDTLATSLVSLWTGDKVGAADALLAAEPADALSRGNDPSSRSTSLKTFTFVTAAATAATEPLLPGDGDRLFLIIAAGKRLPRHPLVLRPLSFVGCADFRSLKTPPKNTEPRVARPRPCFADGSPKADAPSTSEPRQW